ncbi:hypothetical protein DV735_g1061, partial [Chaetothyriales sp. CBS 134920]
MDLPPTRPPLPQTEDKVLSFDIYGSIIEYISHATISRPPPSSPFLNPAPPLLSIKGAALQGARASTKSSPTAAQLVVPTTADEATHFASAATIASWPTFLHALSHCQTLTPTHGNSPPHRRATVQPARLGSARSRGSKVFTADDAADTEDDLRRADDAKLDTRSALSPAPVTAESESALARGPVGYAWRFAERV